MKPVVLRNVALRNGDEARQPRFRRQQIVEGAVESSGSFGVGEAEANRKNAPPAVVQKVEVHGVGERGHASGERPQRIDGHRLRNRRSLHRLEHGPAPVGDLAGGNQRLRLIERSGRPRELRSERLEGRDALLVPGGVRDCDDCASQTIDLRDGLVRAGSRVARR
jgi:hypothetical protein